MIPGKPISLFALLSFYYARERERENKGINNSAGNSPI
jgi:hypothetical protein